MTANITTYNDFQGLSKLHSEASARSPEATREAARQFEALFVQMMLKSMRDANAVLGEQQDTTYQEMFDKQIAMEMSQGKGLGLGKLMLGPLGGTSDSTTGAPATLSMPLLLSRLPALHNTALPNLAGLVAPDLAIPDPATPSLPGLQAQGTGTSGMNRNDFRPETHEDFVREVWPLAVRAGQQLGVNPRAIVAQAALETGWGSRLIRDDAGVSGNNLFGIKADASWTGERVTVNTLEYEGGLPKPQRSQFRAYPDLASGFADYVGFLKGNPRYSDALRAGDSTEVYAGRLQSAGYATDPNYAEKIRAIIASPILSATGPALKSGGDLPNYL